MAAPPTSLFLSLDSALQPFLHHRSNHHPSTSTPTPTPTPTSLSLPNHHLFPFKLFRRSSHPPTSSLPAHSPPRPAPFLDAFGLARLQTLDKFCYAHEFDHGSLDIRPMEPDELDTTATLLAESFVESMWLPARYVPLLAFLVKQYVIERQHRIPHATTLVGLYSGKDGGDAKLVCTAEISFDALGANDSPPTPLPPVECPYICNMAVTKQLRRRGIGWQLLKASEELISQMKTSRRVYLHCRVVDKGPFRMYTKAGYKVVKTDSILIWLTLQRRKYLMFKELPIRDDQWDTSDSVDHPI